MIERAAQTIQFPDDHYILRADLLEQFFSLDPIGPCTAGSLDKNLLTARLLEGIHLQRDLLLFGTDSGVTEMHPVASLMNSAMKYKLNFDFIDRFGRQAKTVLGTTAEGGGQFIKTAV